MVELSGGAEPVEEFLKNVADEKESIAEIKMPAKGSYMGVVFINPRPLQHQRSDGGVNDQIHDRDGPSCSPIPFGIRSCRAP